MKLCLALRTSYIPPIHMPAWPVSESTIASSGTWRESSAQILSGRIGAASDSSATRYLSFHSPHIFFTWAIHAFRLEADERSTFSRARERQTLASPSTPAL